MSKAYDFLCECGHFFVLTDNDGFPAGRPFGAVMEIGDDLYLSTGNQKSVYYQFCKNPMVQIIALKSGTREWIRISGCCSECLDESIRDRMLTEIPRLRTIYEAEGMEHYAVIKVQIRKIEWM